jgi:F-type H+-transporting ATPase subunit gamma
MATEKHYSTWLAKRLLPFSPKPNAQRKPRREPLMSGTTESLSRKLAGANDLQGVVRSMKALAASSIGQYEKAVQSLDSYYRTVELAITACLRPAAPEPLAESRSLRRGVAVGAILFGSDQGLVGRFNEVLLECATNQLKALPGKTMKIWAIGDRIQALVADSGLAPSSLLSVPTSVDAITSFVGQILVEIEQARERGDVTEVYVFHNHPTAGTFYEPVCKRLLPLDLSWQKKIASLPWPTKTLPEIIESMVPALAAFIREYLFVLLFQACAESLASENASRLAAMQRAEKNIEDILDDLNRTFHRIRQETIDEELFDVISGFDALTARHV